MERTHFSEDLIQRIRQESDIVNLVSSYVSLKKSGQNWAGLCPFHTEKTPSFTVSSVKQFYHCFGCGAGGDAIGFVMKMEGLTFPQAIKLLAEKLGIQVLSNRVGATDQADQLREQLYRIHRDAADYFHSVLLKQPDAQRARQYLERRGITTGTIEEFWLGYAPPGWNGLEQILLKKGWPVEQIETAGLIIAKDPPASGRRHCYDRFRDRIIFPIFDLQRRVIGFGGRVLDDSLPKYLNSPETPIFSKGNQLYALEKAREAAGKCGYLVVVEGYFDAIAAHQAGSRAVVATLGTAMTPNHLERIHRFVQTVKLVFDPDEAGIRAALRCLDLIIPSPVSGEVVLLPAGEDPDSFIKIRGVEAFEELLSHSTKLLDFAIQHSVTDPAAKTIEGKLRIVDRILPVIRKVTRPIERGYYIKHLAESLGLEERELTAEMTRLRQKETSVKTATDETPPVKFPKEEQIIIHLLLHNPGMVHSVAEEIQPEHFTDPRLQRIYSLLVESSKQRGIRSDLWVRPDTADPALGPIVTALTMSEPDYDDSQQTLADCIRTLRLKKIRSAMRNLENQIRSAEKTGDGPLVKSLQGQLIGLKKMTMEVNG